MDNYLNYNKLPLDKEFKKTIWIVKDEYRDYFHKEENARSDVKNKLKGAGKKIELYELEVTAKVVNKEIFVSKDQIVTKFIRGLQEEFLIRPGDDGAITLFKIVRFKEFQHARDGGGFEVNKVRLEKIGIVKNEEDLNKLFELIGAS